VATTKFNIAAATELLRDNHLSYVLPAVFTGPTGEVLRAGKT